MRRLRTLLSWSSGKDSAWTLHTLRSDERYEVAGLVTTINESADRVAMHAVRTELLRTQARAARRSPRDRRRVASATKAANKPAGKSWIAQPTPKRFRIRFVTSI